MENTPVISRWLQLRQKMLATYCSLLKIFPFNQENCFSSTELLQQLCNMLHEYLTISDLQIIDTVDPTQFDIKQITHTSYQITNFYNQYIDISSEQLSLQEGLTLELSQLGEVLAIRMEIEDQIIAKKDVSAQSLIKY